MEEHRGTPERTIAAENDLIWAVPPFTGRVVNTVYDLGEGVKPIHPGFDMNFTGYVLDLPPLPFPPFRYLDGDMLVHKKGAPLTLRSESATSWK